MADSIEVKAALDRFRLRCLMSTGAMAAVLGVLLGFGRLSSSEFAAPVSVLITFALVLAFWMEERREIGKLAVVTPVVRTAELQPRGTAYAALFVGWMAWLPLAATAQWLRANWARLPALWPTHWDARGLADRVGARTIGGVYGPLFVGAAVVLMTQALVLMMERAPGPERARRGGMVLPMTIFLWVLSLNACAMALLPIAGPVAPDRVLLGMSGVAFVLLGLVLWGLRRSGVLRSSDEPSTLPAYDGTPDRGWKSGGLIYFNPADASVLVPKRFGVGWTLNFARPVAWLYLGGLVVFLGLVAKFTGVH